MKIFTIEGNIGSGKSTLIDYLKNSNLHFIFIPEPVDLWNEIKDSTGTTILEKYYQEPERYAFSFQMMAYITRLSVINKAVKAAPENSVIIMERSIYTDRHIFAKMLYDSKKILEIEYSIYLRWFNELSTIKIDGIIYVKALPETCIERICQRNRTGESAISLEYIKDCHKYHEEWITSTEIPVLYINGEPRQSLEIIQQIDKFVETYLKK
jgi:deoxyadenosine/deoxycytidine kinase